MNRIYLAGYSGKGNFQRIEETLSREDAQLIDIRFNPYSPNPNYMKHRFSAKFGVRYHHLQAFGNALYESGGLQLLDEANGIARVKAFLAERPVILMCACADPAGCHRQLVRAVMEREGFEVVELNPEPQKTSLF
jgi:uncharacterized protein (DUF488 family)